MAENIVIVDYGSGNLRSVQKAFERAARDRGFAPSVGVSDDPDEIAAADRIVLPGVGAFGACMAGLAALPGGLAALEHAVLVKARPFLGVCVGMQLLADRGCEFGNSAGLGWIAGEVRPIVPAPDRCVPHTGWNEVTFAGPHQVFDSASVRDFYFGHSFHFDPENAAHVIGVTDYHGAIVAAVARDNILGVQFHPEKSQAAGLSLIGDFLAWRP